MKTVFLLMAEFGTTEIPLKDLAEKYLGMTPRRACELATTQGLPFPAYRLDGGQKRPWLVRAGDLAAHLDACRAQAQKEWRAIQEAV